MKTLILIPIVILLVLPTQAFEKLGIESEVESRDLEILIQRNRLKEKRFAGLDYDKNHPTAQNTSNFNDWKGKPSDKEWNLAPLTGLSIFDGKAGMAILGAFAKKVSHEGFVPDINDQVFLEIVLGPLLIDSETAFFSSIHVRWDFQFDDFWRFYSVGGVGNHITGDALGKVFRVFPRFGAGVLMSLSDDLDLRAELSHEVSLIGFSFKL